MEETGGAEITVIVKYLIKLSIFNELILTNKIIRNKK
jgi:hypothetical protein